MFTNITKKLKISAKVVFIIGIVLAILFLLLSFSAEEGAALLIAGVIFFFSTWFTSLLIYAFAELLEDTKAIRENTSNLTTIQNKPNEEQVSNQEEL